MKKAIIVLLAVCNLFFVYTPAGFAAEDDFVMTLQIGNPMMYVNGVEKEIDPGLGTTPLLIDDRTMLPIRAVVEELGGAVIWDEETQTVLLAYQNDIIALAIGNSTAFLNEQPVVLDAVPVLINDRTMLPIRFIAEGFHFNVEWNDEEQIVTIRKSNERFTEN